MVGAGRTQLLRLRNIRPPDEETDSLTPSQVRAMADGSGTLEDYFVAMRSQIRIAQGSQAWTEASPAIPAPIDPTTGEPLAPTGLALTGAGRIVTQEALDGVRDGVNGIFATAHPFFLGGLVVFLNGLPQVYGDEVMAYESQGVGTGYDGIQVTGGLLPREGDSLRATYTRAG